MARVTVEDCLQKIPNRFELVHITTKRVRQIAKGSKPTISVANKPIVTALREVAAGTVGKAEADIKIEEPVGTEEVKTEEVKTET